MKTEKWTIRKPKNYVFKITISAVNMNTLIPVFKK